MKDYVHFNNLRIPKGLFQNLYLRVKRPWEFGGNGTEIFNKENMLQYSLKGLVHQMIVTKDTAKVRNSMESYLDILENNNKICKNFWNNYTGRGKTSPFFCGFPLKITISRDQVKAVANFAAILYALDPNDEHKYLERLSGTFRKTHPKGTIPLFADPGCLKKHAEFHAGQHPKINSLKKTFKNANGCDSTPTIKIK